MGLGALSKLMLYQIIIVNCHWQVYYVLLQHFRFYYQFCCIFPLLQLAGCTDLLAVPVHCGGGATEHPHCPVQQEL